MLPVLRVRWEKNISDKELHEELDRKGGEETIASGRN
jgi:hypothetical protein